jgi:hypothetical protein
MMSLVDFEELEANEVVAHMRGVFRYPALQQQLAAETSPEVLGGRYFESGAPDAVEELQVVSQDFHRCRKFKTNRSRYPQIEASSRHDEYATKAQAQKRLNCWCSIATALVRHADGFGRGRRGQQLQRSAMRRERECALGKLDDPVLIHKYKKWLRSPFALEPVEVAKRKRSAKTRKPKTDFVETKTPGTALLTSPSKSDAAVQECSRCGCSSVFDKYGDRICWCDSCWSGCLPCEASKPKQRHHNHWEDMVARLLEAHVAKTMSTHRKRFARRMQPSVSYAQRWAFLHSSFGGNVAMEGMTGALPQELTLSYQHTFTEMMQQHRQQRRIHRRWFRMLFNACERSFRSMRRHALEELSSNRRVGQHGSHDALGVELGGGTTSVREIERVAEDENVLAAMLGLDLSTYRMLKQLEEREIVPEDYELLGRLDEQVKPATLTLEELQRFPTKVHTASCNATCNHTLASFGIDFWRLPLKSIPLKRDDMVEPSTDRTRWSTDFWKLPSHVLEDDDDEIATTADVASSLEDLSCVCGVCLLEFDVGDELRSLPCGHSFHRECIDHWLLNSSTVCPVDKRDFREK